MLRAWTVAHNRAAEAVRLAEVPDGALMQRAAAGLAAVCAGELRARCGGVSGRRVALLVGAGNNGGDALFAGERLARRGARVDAVLLAPVAKVHAAGLAALRAAGGRTVFPEDGAATAAALGRADLLIDGIVGLGGTKGLRDDAARVLHAASPRAVVVAVDLPSGVDPDTGELPEPDAEGPLRGVRRHVVADVTVTFGAHKPCHLAPPADAVCGRIVLVDIGLLDADQVDRERGPLLSMTPAVERLEDADAAALWPVPRRGDHKYTRGVLGVVAGSTAFPGAAVLAVSGAVRAGVGMVRYVGPPEVTAAVLARRPEVVAGRGRVQAWLIGSGVTAEGASRDGQFVEARAALVAAREDRLPVLLDAGALELLRRPAPAGGAVITPHAGELATLLTTWGEDTTRAQIEAAPLVWARRAAALTGVTVLLKGATTVIVQPADAATERPERVRTQADATPWLATAGAGDVLAGVAGALLAAGLDPFDAASLAALVHGRAARIAAGPTDGPTDGPAGDPGGGPITALDVAAALPHAVRTLPHAVRTLPHAVRTLRDGAW